jgi:uncharacterized membrane protein
LSNQGGEATPRRPRPRLESLSDLIYGLSLSIGAISLVITNSQTASASDINQNILEFIFVFLILITSWIIYTSDMSVLPAETRLVTFLNVVLLLLVAIIPYLFDQVVSRTNPSPVQDYASILFTVDFSVTLVVMAVFAHIIVDEESHLVDGDVVPRFHRSRNILFFLATLVLASLVAPWDWTLFQIHVRLLIWYAPIVMFWFNRMRQRPLPITKSPTLGA